MLKKYYFLIDSNKKIFLNRMNQAVRGDEEDGNENYKDFNEDKEE